MLSSSSPTDLKIKISSKKLQSGKCQVKFFADVPNKQLYGYVLVNAESTLKDVMHSLKLRLGKIKYSDNYHHIHLFSLYKERQDNNDFILYDSSSI